MSQSKEFFLTLYQPVHLAFERFCKARSYGKMSFKDLMQESLLIAFSKFNKLEDPDKFLYFLFGIATRVLSNQQKKLRYTALSEVDTNGSVVESVAERSADVERLYKALSLLPPDQREAIILFEIVGFSVREIAGYQKRSEESVRQQLSRGRKRLLDLLTEKAELKSLSYE
jgi:RNA polymerase sigma-70 factor (ECF subfamily)